LIVAVVIPANPPAPEALLSLTQLACAINENGNATHGSRRAINRWCTQGVKVKGKTVTLPAIREGGRWIIRWGDFMEFRRQCTAAAGGASEECVPTPRELQRRADAAVAGMEKLFASLKPKKRKPKTHPKAA
jgi:hypothetical protein